MANRRFETFRLLLLLVLLSLLDLAQFAVDLARLVRNVNGNGRLAHVVLGSDLHRCEEGSDGSSICSLVICGATFAPSLTKTSRYRSIQLADQVFGGKVTLSLLRNDLIKRLVVV